MTPENIPAERLANYLRVSTEDQSLERQSRATFNYAKRHFDANINDMQTYRDKSTGTNTKRDGYNDMMEAAENNEIDVLIVKDLTRLARSLRDLDRTIERLTEENGVEVHFVDENMQFTNDKDDPFQEFQMQVLGAVAEFQAKIRQQTAREGIAARRNAEEYHHGPAPLGFTKDNGNLYEKENYDEVCEKLDMVVKDEMSKREAADELDTSRATIRRAIEERAELYNL